MILKPHFCFNSPRFLINFSCYPKLPSIYKHDLLRWKKDGNELTHDNLNFEHLQNSKMPLNQELSNSKKSNEEVELINQQSNESLLYSN